MGALSTEELLDILRGATEDVLSTEESSLQRDDELLQRLRDAALRLLSVRDRSTYELRQRLIDKGFPREDVQELIQRFTAVGLLNDSAFAHNWVQHRLAHSARGRRVLEAELRQKGIASEVIDEELMAIDEADEAHAAFTFLQSKASRYSPQELASSADFRKAQQRLFNMLLRRGYSYELAKIVSFTVLAERQSEDS